MLLAHTSVALSPCYLPARSCCCLLQQIGCSTYCRLASAQRRSCPLACQTHPGAVVTEEAGAVTEAAAHSQQHSATASGSAQLQLTGATGVVAASATVIASASGTGTGTGTAAAAGAPAGVGAAGVLPGAGGRAVGA